MQLSERHCEYCHLEFDSETLVNQHVKTTHISCNFCLFQGSRDALDAHYSTKHPGKAPVLKRGVVEDPAEIAAWIAERKKKYPTEANVEQKKLAQKDKLEAGMILQSRTSVKSTQLQRSTTSTSTTPPSKKVDGNDDDDEEVGILTEEEEEGQINPVRKERQQPKKKAQICKYYASGKCKNGTNCLFTHIKEAPVLKVDKPALGGGKRRNLRSMLLESQIRRQNNIILQCIRFVLKEDGRLFRPPDE
ncbi:hypothetical protein BDR26DRAFT_872659 [Obelidium mucronatum]|nr:hypothetical protein BDR26DRAFT_872659 [Obelidium mucronatum]